MKKNNFFFVIDVGNTNIVIALVKNFKIYQIVRFETLKFKKNNYLLFNKFKSLKKILKMHKKLKCIISSVVPEINTKLKKMWSFFLKNNPHFVSSSKTNLNIKINLKNKKQLGADRIVNTVAVKSIYKSPALVIDFGTATTFDIIDNNGNYAGGLISPGINLSINDLYNKASQLPLIKFKKKKDIIGKNTKNAMENGLYWGFIGLVSFIIKKIQSKFKKKLFCISTGGLSRIISKDINSIDTINENLTILGLIEIFKLNQNE